MLAPAPVLRFFACLLALLPLSVAARAQDPTPTPTPLPQTMALSSPFALTAKPLTLLAKSSRWFPVAVTLSNTGDPVSGTLRLRLIANGEFNNAPNETYCPVDLPSNSHKVIWMYGRMERPNVGFVELNFSGRGFPAMTQRVQIVEPMDGQRVVVTIADTDTGLSNTLAGLRGPGIALRESTQQETAYNQNSGQPPVRAMLAPRTDVPDRWFGLENADMVVLGDFPHTALQPAQISALRGFVAGGGNMLVLGGNSAARLSSSPLADLWPGQISNYNTASPAEVAGLVRRYVPDPKNGGDRLGGSPVVVTRCTLKPNAQLRDGSKSSPLYSVLDTGAGRVQFLGYDPSQPPFAGWSGQVALWRDLFSSGANVRRLEGIEGDNVGYGYNQAYQPGYNSSFNDSPPSTPTGILLGAMSKAPQLSMPPVSSIAWFLSLYVFVLVPLNYAVLRFIDRRELAWITIPVIVAAFSAFAYFAALSIRGNAILTRQIDVVQTTLGSKTARTDSLLWLFSPRRTTYDISSSRDDAAVDDFANEAGGRQGAFSILQPADATSFKVEGANVWMWTDRGFVSQSLADLKSGFSMQGNKLVNGTPFDMKGVVFVQNQGVREIGDINAGASAVVPTKTSTSSSLMDLPGAIANASHLEKIFDPKTVSNGIPSGALNAALASGSNSFYDGSLLVGWMKKSTVPLSIGMGDAKFSDMTLMLIRVPSTTVSANATMAAKQVTVRTIARVLSKSKVNGNYPLTCTFEAVAPFASTVQLHFSCIPARNGVPQPPGTAMTMPYPRNFYVSAQGLNASTGRWFNLSTTLRMRRAKSSAAAASTWDYYADMPTEFLRQPDRHITFRATWPSDGTRVRVTVEGG